MLLLVVSSEPTLRDYLAHVCQHFGYSVDFADDVGDALDRVGELDSYGVMLFDAITSAQTERDLAALCRLAPDCDVIVLSDDPPGRGERWIRQGAAGVLRAPVLPSKLKYELLRRASQAA